MRFSGPDADFKKESTMTYPAGIDIDAAVTHEQSGILTSGALAFVAELARKFEPERLSLLKRRAQRQAELDAGRLPDFLPETAAVRNGDWTIAAVPAELSDRRVEITGPAERKMLINGLNAGASVYMADLEDSMTPSWHNVIDAQINLRDAVNRTIKSRQSGRQDLSTCTTRCRCCSCARAAGTWWKNT